MSTTQISKKQAYVRSMENDAQFIESVSELFNGLAGLQRTVVQDLKWEAGNKEYQKIQKAVAAFEKSKQHIANAIKNTEHLLGQLEKADREKLEERFKVFKPIATNVEKRLKSILKTLESQQLPDNNLIHETIEIALRGVGFGMEVSKKNTDETFV